MTAPTPGPLGEAESDLNTAQSQTDPHRRAQYARSAADAATEVAMDSNATDEARAKAKTIARSAHTLIAGSVLCEAQTTLATAQDESNPQRRRELASSALANARSAATDRDLTDLERAQARQIMAASRMIVNTLAQNRIRQQVSEPEHESPGIAL